MVFTESVAIVAEEGPSITQGIHVSKIVSSSRHPA